MTEQELQRLFLDARGAMHYPAYLYIGGVGLEGGWDRLVATFVPCTADEFKKKWEVK
jgi:hypothetical protein